MANGIIIDGGSNNSSVITPYCTNKDRICFELKNGEVVYLRCLGKDQGFIVEYANYSDHNFVLTSGFVMNKVFINIEKSAFSLYYNGQIRRFEFSETATNNKANIALLPEFFKIAFGDKASLC